MIRHVFDVVEQKGSERVCGIVCYETMHTPQKQNDCNNCKDSYIRKDNVISPVFEPFSCQQRYRKKSVVSLHLHNIMITLHIMYCTFIRRDKQPLFAHLPTLYQVHMNSVCSFADPLSTI